MITEQILNPAEKRPMRLPDGAELLIFDDNREKQAAQLLFDAGFAETSAKKEGKAVFRLFKNGDTTVYMTRLPGQQALRIVEKKHDAFVSEPAAPAGPYPTLLTQVKLSYISVDCGMTYVLRLSDGRFVLLDSGYNEYEEDAHLLDLLNEQNVLGGKPKIAAWFFSHAHEDHFGGFCALMEHFADKVTVESVIYNFPMESAGGPPTPFYRILAQHPEIRIVIARTGQVYHFADAVLTALFTGEDLLPESCGNLNDSSLVLRLEVNGKRVLLLGDAQGQASDCIMERLGEESVRSDIVQVGHHGYGGGSDTLYRASDPELLLWPCPDYWYPVVSLWPSNNFLIHSEKIHSILIGGQGEAVVNLSEPLKPIAFAKPETGVFYEEDFKKERVTDLGWSFLNGGRMIYRAGTIRLENGAIIGADDNMTACAFVQPWKIQKKKSLKIAFSGVALQKTERLGLMWAYDHPTEYEEDRVLWLDVLPEEPFTFVLTVKDQKATLQKNGGAAVDVPCGSPRGLHFVLKNGQVKITHIRVTDGK